MLNQLVVLCCSETGLYRCWSVVLEVDPLLRAILLFDGVLAGLYERHCDSATLCCVIVTVHASGGFRYLSVVAEALPGTWCHFRGCMTAHAWDAAAFFYSLIVK